MLGLRELEVLGSGQLVALWAEAQALRVLAGIWSPAFLALSKKLHIEYKISVLVG